MANVLIIDDNEKICQLLSIRVMGLGHHAESAQTLADGERMVRSQSFDVVFLDVGLPDGSGLEALPAVKKSPSSPEVIIITASGDPDGAELAIKNGAWDYIQKPFSSKEIDLQLTRALQYRKEKGIPKSPVVLRREGIIGESLQLRNSLEIVAQAANSNGSALVCGETGTGKELFAWAIHKNSPRRNRNFVVVDCAALPESLVESTLFGHEKGAFTGADTSQEGLVKQADKGTLFLDEIGELPISVQKTFLRVLQEHRFRPVGSNKELESNFRLVAATNRDLEKMAEQGRFRSDLLFRLQTFIIDLPPLRDHLEDLEDLSIYYIKKLCAGYQTVQKGISPDFLQALSRYNWPGNVRELINTLEKAIASARNEPTLFAKHLPMSIRVKLARLAVGKRAPREADPPTASRRLATFRKFREKALMTIEQQYLKDLMAETGGNISEACRISDLSRSRLYALLKKHGLT